MGDGVSSNDDYDDDDGGGGEDVTAEEDLSVQIDVFGSPEVDGDDSNDEVDSLLSGPFPRTLRVRQCCILPSTFASRQ